MKRSPERLLPAENAVYYLFGEDQDTIAEIAEALLCEGDEHAIRLRVDVSELARIENENKNQDLFGATACYALVRNAQQASPAQGTHLLKLCADLAPGNRLVVCAPDMSWKKALHKNLLKLEGIISCDCRTPGEAEFRSWLAARVHEAGLKLEEDVLDHVSERLHGMRLAARQLIERLRLYDGGREELLSAEVVFALLGERAPGLLESWCQAVAQRKPGAVSLARRLLDEQQVAEVQMVAWLSIRLQQLLMYRWFSARGERDPCRAARIFGPSKKRVAEEAGQWKGSELVWALGRVTEAERLIKGSSEEDNSVVIERLTMDLVQPERMER